MAEDHLAVTMQSVSDILLMVTHRPPTPEGAEGLQTLDHEKNCNFRSLYSTVS